MWYFQSCGKKGSLRVISTNTFLLRVSYHCWRSACLLLLISKQREKCVGVVVVFFYCISAGGTQALICIDVPLLLIITGVISLFFLRIRNFSARMLRIFQVAGISLESCVELWFLNWIALKDCFQHHSLLPAICSKGCFFFQLWNAANLAPVPQGVGRKSFSPAVAEGNSLQLLNVPERGERRMKPDIGHYQAELCSVNSVQFGSEYLSVLAWATQLKKVLTVCERQTWSFLCPPPLPQFWLSKVCDTEKPGAESQVRFECSDLAVVLTLDVNSFRSIPKMTARPLKWSIFLLTHKPGVLNMKIYDAPKSPNFIFGQVLIASWCRRSKRFFSDRNIFVCVFLLLLEKY